MKSIALTDLETAWKRLALQWEESTQLWDDAVRRDFEQRYWTPLTSESQGDHSRKWHSWQKVIRKARHVVK